MIGVARSTVVNGGGQSLENWMAGLDATRAMVENGVPSEELRALRDVCDGDRRDTVRYTAARCH